MHLYISPSIVSFKCEEFEEMGDKNEESEQMKNEDDQLHNAMGEKAVVYNQYLIFYCRCLGLLAEKTNLLDRGVLHPHMLAHPHHDLHEC